MIKEEEEKEEEEVKKRKQKETKNRFLNWLNQERITWCTPREHSYVKMQNDDKLG